MIALWSLIFPAITLGDLTTELSFKKLPSWMNYNSNYFSFIESKNEIKSSNFYTYIASCVYLLPTSLTMTSLNFDSNCYLNDNICANQQEKNNISSLSPQEYCPMLGSMDKVAIFSANYFNKFLDVFVNSTYIVIEGCYINGSKNEKIDVVWTATDYKYYDYTVGNNFFNNITSSNVYNGEIFFADGGRNCSKLCENIDCEEKVISNEKVHSEETFTLGTLYFFVIVLGITTVIVILITILKVKSQI